MPLNSKLHTYHNVDASEQIACDFTLFSIYIGKIALS